MRNGKGHWAKLRALGIGESVWIPGIKSGTAGGHANAVFGAGNYMVRKEGHGARVWRLRGARVNP